MHALSLNNVKLQENVKLEFEGDSSTFNVSSGNCYFDFSTFSGDIDDKCHGHASQAPRRTMNPGTTKEIHNQRRLCSGTSLGT